MKDLFQLIGLIIQATTVGLTTPPASTLIPRYLRGLKLLAKLATLVPIPFAVLGIVTGKDWITSSAGVWCSFFLASLMIWAAPIGVVLEKVLGWNNFTGERYVALGRAILLWEVLTFVGLSITPLRNNWAILPLLILLIVAVVLMVYEWGKSGGFLKEAIWYGSIAGIIISILTMFKPIIVPYLKMAMAPFSSMGFRSSWGFRGDMVWNEWKILGLLVGVVGVIWILSLLYRAARSAIKSATGTAVTTTHTATTHTPAASSHGGSHGHGGGGASKWGKWILATVIVTSIIFIFIQARNADEVRRRSQWAASDSNGRQAFVTHGFVTALPDREVPIYIPEGMVVSTDPAYTNQRVWVRYDGADRFMDWKGRTNAGIVVHNNLRSRHLFLQSAEATPVVVEWSLRPLPNR